jgi:hypothetical protein
MANALTTLNAFHGLQCSAPCVPKHSLATKVESSLRPDCILLPTADLAPSPDLIRLDRLVCTFLHRDLNAAALRVRDSCAALIGVPWRCALAQEPGK